MNSIKLISIILIGIVLWGACTQDRPIEYPRLFDMENLVAWCIVPYDNQNRTPQQRAEMLNELGFTKMAWDWRDEHLPLFPEEIRMLKEHDIELSAVWLWVDERATGGLLPEQTMIFNTLERKGVSTRIWLGVHENFYAGLDETEKVEKLAGLLLRVRFQAQRSGSTVSLYNHRGWLGIPENQVRVIEAAGLDDVGIVLNFHHSHAQIDRFGEALEIIMPYLETVNLSGMEKDGAQILDIGMGDYEKEMIATLLESGFEGNIGVIGHTYGEDVKQVLSRNLKGLQEVLSELGESFSYCGQ